MASQDATNRYNGQLIPLFSLTVMNASTLPDVEQARFNMVEQQVRPWDVLDANVLQALFDVRREQFVPPALRALAFSDLEIPLQINGVDSRQNMLAPKIEARLAQELQLTKSDCVLEIGTGSGYQAALLGYLAQQVTSVEIDSRLVTFAQQNLQMNNVTNVKVETGDARNGWGSTEYDAILVTGSVPAVPDALKYQLRVGGRLVVIVGQAPVMTACRITRTTAASFETVNLFETVIKPRATVSQFVLIRRRPPSRPAGMRADVLEPHDSHETSCASDRLRHYWSSPAPQRRSVARPRRRRPDAGLAHRAGQRPGLCRRARNYRASLERNPRPAPDCCRRSAPRPARYRETRSTQGFGMAYSGGRGTWDLALTQPLFNWSRWQAYEQSKLLTADAEVRLQQAFQDLLLRVAEAYFNVLYAQDALTATEAEKAAVAGQLESAKRNFELGNATITDTYEAQARYDLVLAQELRLQNDLDVRRDVLAQILGSPAGALAELPPGVRLPSPQPARLNDWSTQAEASSLDVLRAQLQTRIAGRDIQIARSGHYPTVNLRATSGSASDAVMSNGSSAPGKPINNSVGVVLSIPLYSGGGVSSQVTERVQLEQKARHDFEAARRQAVQAARQHYTGVTSGLARIDALEAGEKSSRASVEANRTGYEVGVRISLDVLNAQQQLYATQRDLALARYTRCCPGCG